jgi:hypothetical protein
VTVVDLGTADLSALIREQERDMLFGHRRPSHPLEILAGLNPAGMKKGRPRYFLSGRKIARRPQGRQGAVVECGTATMYRYGCRCWRCRHAQSVRRKYQRLRGIR